MSDEKNTQEFEPITQIEVTPQMLAAGAQVVEDSAHHGMGMQTSSAELIALSVFEAMLSERR